MKTKPSKLRFFGYISFGLLFLLSSITVYSQPEQESSSSSLSRVNFSLGGGYAHSEGRNGMVDVKAEIQFSISTAIRAGLSVGYLSDSDNRHMGGNIGGMSGGMMSGMMDSQMGSFSGHNHNFRVIPLTLSIYYVLPVNPKVDIFMVGGGGYYLSSFRDISRQEKNALGAHAGFGFDFKVANRIMITAEGIYRFVNLEGFTSELHPGFMEGDEHQEGFWHYHHHHDEWHFHEEHEDQEQMMMDSPDFNISLNGFSLRAGIKFNF